MLMAREALAHLGISMQGATVAVQGFGNVGSITAKLMADQGCKIVAIGDRAGAFHNAKGIDVDGGDRATCRSTGRSKGSPAAIRSTPMIC